MKKKVILIGGSPMSGKSTVAKMVANHFSIPCASTDDLGIMASAITDYSSHQDLHYMGDLDHKEYYILNSIEDLRSDIIKCHKSLWPGIRRVIQAHLQWAGPIVLEGYALYPSLISKLDMNEVVALWILCDSEVYASRYDKCDFSLGASNPDLMRKNYLGRTSWHNELIEDEAEKFNFPIVKVDSNCSIENLFQRLLKHICA